MNERYNRLGKDIVIFAIGTIGSKLILFLLVPLYTNILSTSEYGTADLILTVGQLLIPCVSLCIYEALFRFGLKKGVSQGDVLLVAMVVFLLGSVVVTLSAPLFRLYNPIAPWTTYLVTYVVSLFFNNIMMVYIRVKDLKKLYALLVIGQAGLLMGFNIIFLVALNLGVSGYLLSTILSSFITAVLAFFCSSSYNDIRKAKWNKSLLIDMLKYSAPLIFNSISWNIIYSSDKVMLELMLGAAVLGLYTAAAKMPSLLNVVTTIFIQAWELSTISEYETSNNRRVYASVFSKFRTVMFTSFFVICIVLRPLMSIYVGNEYYEAWRYVPILLLSACFTAFSGFFSAFYNAVKKSMNAMLTTMIAGVCNVVVNLYLIPIIGVFGAAIGTLAAYVVITVIRMVDIHRYIPFDYELARFIPLSILSLVIAVMYSLNKQSVFMVLVLLIIMVLIDYKNYISIVRNAFLFFRNLKCRLARR